MAGLKKNTCDSGFWSNTNFPRPLGTRIWNISAKYFATWLNVKSIFSCFFSSSIWQRLLDTFSPSLQSFNLLTNFFLSSTNLTCISMAFMLTWITYKNLKTFSRMVLHQIFAFYRLTSVGLWEVQHWGVLKIKIFGQSTFMAILLWSFQGTNTKLERFLAKNQL